MSEFKVQGLLATQTERSRVKIYSELTGFFRSPEKKDDRISEYHKHIPNRKKYYSVIEDNIIEKRIDKLPVEENDGKQSGSGRRHLFGRQKPLHAALGSGKAADILLWRQKQMSGAIFVSATVIWLLFERIGYHLLPFLCHFLILTLAILFLWSNLSSYVNKSPPKLPDIRLSQEMCDCIVLLLKDRINQACLFLREMTSGKDLKRFLSVIFTLWIVSVIGGWFEFLTLVYILFVLLLTAPLLYERNENLVDAYGEKLGNEIMAALQKLPCLFSRTPNNTD